jgi:predicted transcriptional regulator
MAATRAWTDQDDTKLRAHHATGKSLSEIAREMNRSKATISTRAAALELSWDRAQTAAATEAHRADAARLRAQLELGLLQDAQHIRARLRAPMVYFEWGGKDHDYAEKAVDEPTPTDQLKLMQAAGAAIDRSLRISTHDSGGDLEQSRSMVTDLAHALGVDLTLPDEEPPGDDAQT